MNVHVWVLNGDKKGRGRVHRPQGVPQSHAAHLTRRVHGGNAHIYDFTSVVTSAQPALPSRTDICDQVGFEEHFYF